MIQLYRTNFAGIQHQLMSELIVIEPGKETVQPPKRSTYEQLSDAERWLALLRLFPDGQHAKMALTNGYLRQYGVTLGHAARKRLRRRWHTKSEMTEPFDRLCWLAMEGAAGVEGEEQRKQECERLVTELTKTAEG